jgi:hypothetical protein
VRELYKSLQYYFQILKEYFKYKTIDFENIEFYNHYTAFLHKNIFISQYSRKHIKTIKSFMNEATERGINENLEFRKRNLRLSEKNQTVYLSIKELQQFEKLN